MLAPLDNGTIFKKAFSDKDVFLPFIKDLFNIDIEVETIETEKQFVPPISPVDFKLDIYAESKDHSIIIEIQKIDYDYNFDRFLHYFLTLVANQQKSSSDYKFTRRVLGIVVFARPYRFNQKDGQPVRDNVLIMDFNPKNIKGKPVNLYDHNLIFLNSSKKYQNDETPVNYKDWLDLLYASIKTPKDYKLNLENKGIAKAVKIIEYETLDPETLRQMKEDECKKEMEVLNDRDSRTEEKIEIAINAIKEELPDELINKLTSLSIETIQNLRKQIE